MFSITSTITPKPNADWALLSEPMVVIWAQPETDRLFTMALSRLHKPVQYSYHMVVSAIEHGQLLPGERELPTAYTMDDRDLPLATRRKRDEWYEVIEPLIPHIETYLVGEHGASLVAQRAKATGRGRQQIYHYLHRYLKFGQNRSALLPDLHLCGQSPEREVGPKKRGRPRRNTDVHGRNFLPQDKKNLQKILDKYYIREDGWSLVDCYQQFLDEHYVLSTSYNAENQPVVKHYHPDDRPSKDQFDYHARLLLDPQRDRVERIRDSSTDYDKDRSGRSGNAPIPRGPGQIYQLDATEYDLELVSHLSPDRTLRSGRATFYVVIDAFSSMIVGMHLTLEAPSWAAARIALFNAFRPKRAYCQELGITIDEANWPVSGIGAWIYVDNAELQNELSTPGPQDAGFSVAFGRVCRGDDKGLVENAIKRQSTASRNMPGYIRKRKNRSGGRDNPKLEARLTLPELYQFLVHETLHHNNVLGIDETYLDAEMIADGVPAVPRKIWNWGERNRPYIRKGATEAQLYLDLLEKGKATVLQNGVNFIDPTDTDRPGLLYRCNYTLSQGLQNQKQAANRSPEFEVRFMRHNLDTIFLVTPDGLMPAHLQDRERRYHGLPVEEVVLRQDVEAAERNAREPAEYESRASVNRFGADLSENARNEQRRLPPAQVAKQSIRDNREADLEDERRAEAERYAQFVEAEYGTPAGRPAQTNPPQQDDDPAEDRRNAKFFNAWKQQKGGSTE